MKTFIKTALLIIAVVVAAGYFYQRKLDDRAVADAALTLYGNVDIRQVALAFRAGGRIEKMVFEEGDKVTKGAVLAMLDRGPLEDGLALSKAQVGIAEASMDKLNAGTRPGEIALAGTVVEERQIMVDNLMQILSRQKRLARSGAVPKQSADDAQAQYDAAVSRLQSAKETLGIAEEGARAEDLAIGQAELEAARARVAMAERQLSDTELDAPCDGVILTRVQEPGAIVGPGSTVYTLSLTSPVWVRSYISEPDMGRIHPGMVAEVVTDSRPEEPYRGQVGFISPVAEFTPKSVETEDLRTDLVYRLRVIIKEPDEALRQGMPVTIRFPDV